MSAVQTRAPASDPATTDARERAAGRSSRRVRRDLEGLRAIAVLGVVVFHLRESWLPGGFAGVDVFFVLSGFLITGLLVDEIRRTGRLDLLAFWGRRARRLLPAATLVAVGTMLFALLFVDAIDAARFADDGAFTALFAVNWHYADAQTSYFADNAASPFTHYWSLGLEEQFYLLWPVLLLAIALATRRRTRGWITLLATGIAIGSFVIALHLTSSDQPYAYFATYSRVWQLAVGAFLACVAVAWTPAAWLRAPLRWSGIAAIVGFYALAAPDPGSYYPGWYALLPALGAAVIIAAGLPGRTARHGVGRRAELTDPARAALSSAPAQVIGRYSYGWYLWHWPPLVLVPLWLGHPLTVTELVAIAAISFAGAAAGYHLVEHPIRSSRSLTVRRGRRSLALGVALIVLGTGSALALGGVADYRTDHTTLANAHGNSLDPQPGAANSQLPRPTTDGCEVGLSSSELSRDCRYLPDSGNGDVVLTGDSHAVQWFSGVYGVAKSKGWGMRVWARASCPLAEVTKMISGGPAEDCNRWRDDVMDRLVAARPSLVVIGGYASKIPSLYDRSGDLVGGTGAKQMYEDGLVTQLTRLRAARIPVLVIRDNPSFDTTAPKCALTHEKHLAACSETLKHAIRTGVELHAVRRVPGTTLLDLTAQLCIEERCYQVLGSTLAYRDDNHLTQQMVGVLTPRLRAAMEQATR